MRVISATVCRIEDNPTGGKAVATLIGKDFSGRLVVNSCGDQLRYELADGTGVRTGSQFFLEMIYLSPPQAPAL